MYDFCIILGNGNTNVPLNITELPFEVLDNNEEDFILRSLVSVEVKNHSKKQRLTNLCAKELILAYTENTNIPCSASLAVAASAGVSKSTKQSTKGSPLDCKTAKTVY